MTWNGQLVEAVRNEYALRMPQLNAATAKSPVDYQSRLPLVPAGWSTQNLGSGFFKLTAPGASQAALTTWARQQGANYIEDRGQPGRQILRDAQRPAVCKRRQLGVFTNRRARGLPWKGEILFDTADVNSMMSDGTFLSVVLHEMAHAFGFGAVWQQFGLVQGAGTANPIYVGANALREYRTLFGEPRATGVPLETTGGQSTADSHWSERFVVNELMTGFIERPGVSMPISRITVGQFQDLGYRVNYGRADAYAKPTPLLAPPVGSGGGVANSRMRLAVAREGRTSPTAFEIAGFSRALEAGATPHAFASLGAQPSRSGQGRAVRVIG